MIISLIGYMGSGKSTIGRQLASFLQMNMLDLDEYIEQQEGKTIAQLFEEMGETMFRIREREALNEILQSDFEGILSLGGGTPVFFDNMSDINNSSVSVYLNVPSDTLAYRLEKEKDQRPKISQLASDDLQVYISRHVQERTPFYQRAQYILDADKTAQEIVDELVKILRAIS